MSYKLFNENEVRKIFNHHRQGGLLDLGWSKVDLAFLDIDGEIEVYISPKEYEADGFSIEDVLDAFENTESTLAFQFNRENWKQEFLEANKNGILYYHWDRVDHVIRDYLLKKAS